MNPLKNETIPVSGVWLRGVGNDVEVLVEVDGEWRRAIPSQGINTAGGLQTVSHCVHPSGIAKAPVVHFTG